MPFDDERYLMNSANPPVSDGNLAPLNFETGQAMPIPEKAPKSRSGIVGRTEDGDRTFLGFTGDQMMALGAKMMQASGRPGANTFGSLGEGLSAATALKQKEADYRKKSKAELAREERMEGRQLASEDRAEGRAIRAEDRDWQRYLSKEAKAQIDKDRNYDLGLRELEDKLKNSKTERQKNEAQAALYNAQAQAAKAGGGRKGSAEQQMIDRLVEDLGMTPERAVDTVINPRKPEDQVFQEMVNSIKKNDLTGLSADEVIEQATKMTQQVMSMRPQGQSPTEGMSREEAIAYIQKKIKEKGGSLE